MRLRKKVIPSRVGKKDKRLDALMSQPDTIKAIEINRETYEKFQALKSETGLSDVELLEELIRTYSSVHRSQNKERESDSVVCGPHKRETNPQSETTETQQKENGIPIRGSAIQIQKEKHQEVKEKSVEKDTLTDVSSTTRVEPESRKSLSNFAKKDQVEVEAEKSEKTGPLENHTDCVQNADDIPKSQIALVLLSMSQSRNRSALQNQSNSDNENTSSSVPAPTTHLENGRNTEQKDESFPKSNPEKQSLATEDKHKLFKCSQCNYECKKRSDLLTHMRRHTGDRPFKCTECSASFKQRPHLKYHELTHTDTKNFSCGDCDKSFRTKSKLRAHAISHSHGIPKKEAPVAEKSKTKKWSCTICDYKTNRSSDLKKHMNVHSTEKPLTCDLCDFKTAWEKNLKIHRMKHTGEQPHACDECDFRTRDRNALTSHKVKYHSTAKGHICEVCGYVFSLGKLLRQHQVVHSGEKPFECSECSYKTGFQSNLRSHMMMHSAVKQFVCDACGKSFRWKHHLLAHQKNMHPSTEKVYACQVCNFTTSKSQSFNSHMRVHRKKRSKITPKVEDKPMVTQKEEEEVKVSTQTNMEANTGVTTTLEVETLALVENESDVPKIIQADGLLYKDHSYSANVNCYGPVEATPMGQMVSEGAEMNLYPENTGSDQLQLVSNLQTPHGMVLPDLERASQNHVIRSMDVDEGASVVALANEITEQQIFDQQGSNLFHSEEMAAVLNNIIRDFDYQQ